MADIKQAAKWMREGKRVRRPHDEYYVYHMDFYSCLAEVDKDFSLAISIEDLLADDWEIVR